MAPRRADTMEAQDHVRKRVCKACDRCRLKKSKCDGSGPCSRCKADNAICVFGERKKLQDKVYPKGYVEMLEQQQIQLVAGLRELYNRLHKGESWPGLPLRESSDGHPLTHDILERLDLLDPSNDSGSNYGAFEEDCLRMRQKLLDGGPRSARRRDSMSSDSEHGHTSSSHTSTPKTGSFAVHRPFACNNTPPTPPMDSPDPRHSQTVPLLKAKTPMVRPAVMNLVPFDPSTLPRMTWADNYALMNEPMEFVRPMYGFDQLRHHDQTMTLDTMSMNPHDPMMPHWSSSPSDLDFNNFMTHSVGS